MQTHIVKPLERIPFYSASATPKGKHCVQWKCVRLHTSCYLHVLNSAVVLW